MLTDDGDSTYEEIEDGPPLDEAERTSGREGYKQSEDQETIEITAQAALFFILVASCMLLLFYFFDMSVIIVIIYMIGATLSIALVFLYPILLSEYKQKENTDCIFVLSILFSLGLTLLWYFNKEAPWSWVIQASKRLVLMSNDDFRFLYSHLFLLFEPGLYGRCRLYVLPLLY